MPVVAYADSCVREFNENILFSEITNGKQIHTPFMYAHLVDARYEPELKEESINKDSVYKIINVLKSQYRYAQSAGAVKLIKNNNKTTIVNYRGPDSGYNTEYVFKNINDCWKLAGFINWST